MVQRTLAYRVATSYRVQLKNTRSKLLYGNAVYNDLHREFNGRCAFPSEPVVRQAKDHKQHRLGRPPKDPLLQASLDLRSDSKNRLKLMDKSIRENYRGLSHTPEFSFEPAGRVAMPPVAPAEKLNKKKKELQHTSTDSRPGVEPTAHGDARPAKTASSQAPY